MPRNVTAIYRTHETADLVRRELEDIGIPRSDIHVIPDTPHGDVMPDTARGATAAGRAGGAYREPLAGSAGGAHRQQVAGSDEGGTYREPVTGSDAGGAYRESMADMDRLHDLQLPESDLRTYQQCIRRGDYIVSAEVDDESDDVIERAKAVMRRPEAEAHKWREAEFTDAELIAHSKGDTHLRPEHRARPLAGTDDPYLRTYERDKRPVYRDRP